LGNFSSRCSSVTSIVPDPEKEKNEDRKMAMKRSLSIWV
jgi:hypothetical protein